MKRSTKRVVVSAAAGLAFEVLGAVSLAAGLERTARVAAMFPGMLVFYLLPDRLVSTFSESTLFFVGFSSGALVWAVGLWLLATAATSLVSLARQRKIRQGTS